MEGLVGAAFWVDVSKLRELSSCCVLVELREGFDVGNIGAGICRPL